MSKADDTPFRSGNTAALDLDKIEKDPVEADWEDESDESKWKSSGWAGRGEEWPSAFDGKGQGGNTAALDLDAFDPGEIGSAEPWQSAFDDEVANLESWEERNAGRKSERSAPSPTPDFFEVSTGTQALDIDFGDEEEDVDDFHDGLGRRQGNLNVSRRAERSEDARDPHSHYDQRGRKSYGGTSDTPEGTDKDARRRDSKRRARDYEPELEEAPKVVIAEELLPHERTVAIGLNEISGARPDDSQEPVVTTALDTDEAVRRFDKRRDEQAEELDPNERTQAIDSNALISDPAPTTEFEGIYPLPPGDNSATTELGPKDGVGVVVREAPSDGNLVIFVPGNTPVEFSLRPGVTNVGRDRTNHLVLSDPYCSRKHLRIKCQDGRWSVRDNGSDNGTSHNGRPLEEHLDTEIGHFDEIQVGSTVMRFVRGDIVSDARVPPEDKAASPNMGSARKKGMTASISVMDPEQPRQGSRGKTSNVDTWPLLAVLFLLISFVALIGAVMAAILVIW
jgi:hypothetical protein